MSEENVEATKCAVAALNRGDFEGLEELYAADAVLQDLQNSQTWSAASATASARSRTRAATGSHLPRVRLRVASRTQA